MTFLEKRLNERITQGSTGGPGVPGREKNYLATGKLVQNFRASMPIHRYEVSHGLRSAADFQAVLDLWYVVMFTPYEGFRFKDWRDYKLTTSNSRLVLISGSNYQIYRVHTYGGVEFLRPIYKPVSGTVVVQRTRSGVTSTATATVTTTNGQVAITGHVSGDTYVCSAGEFDVPVTFTDDDWTGSLQINVERLHISSGPIKLEEIRLS